MYCVMKIRPLVGANFFCAITSLHSKFNKVKNKIIIEVKGVLTTKMGDIFINMVERLA